jgi:uncharacterized protein
VIIVDTGPLVAASNADDKHHEVCSEVLRSAHASGERLLVPPTVVAEVCYLLAQGSVGPKLESRFLRMFSAGAFVLADLTIEDFDRMAELVEMYGDWPLGGTDASIIALAERLGITKVATLDRRHFLAVRPRHIDAFQLLPEL